MALQPVSLSNVVIPVQNQTIMTLPNMNIGFPQPGLNQLDIDHTQINTFYPLATRTEDNEALSRIPINVANLELLKTKISEIDIDVPSSLDLITPELMINYYEYYYGNIKTNYLELDDLTISEPSAIDVSTLPIDLGKITSLDFIAFDAGMAFLASNGTSPENVIIAENMASEGTGFPVLLSLNSNSEQNLELIQSSNTTTIQVSHDIPLGLNTTQFSSFIVDISSRTETLQIISPDLVTETAYDPQIQMAEFAVLSNIVNQPDTLQSTPISNIKHFFGDLSGMQIRQILDNPQINPDFTPVHTIDDGRFFLNIHGEIASSDLEDFDCRDFQRVGFIGRQGLILIISPEKIAKFALDVKPIVQRLVGDVCKLPKLLFKPEKKKIHTNIFGLSHIDSKGNMRVILSNYDLVQIFGNRDVSLHSLLNLVRIISGGSKNINIDISSCLAVSENFKNERGLYHFRIGDTQRDIPRVFEFVPNKLDPKDAPRVHGKGKDSSCKFGLEKSPSLQKECNDFQSKQAKSQEILDPNTKISGQGILSALNSDMITNIYVLFEVTYPFQKNPLVFHVADNMIPLKGSYYLILREWYHDTFIQDELFESDEFIGLRLNPRISISDILPEIIDVFTSFKKVSTVEFSVFKSRLIVKLQENRAEINTRIK